MGTSTAGGGHLLRDRDFLLFSGGQGMSALGDSLSKTALPLLVLALTDSGLQMGVIAMLSALPTLLLGVPAGAWADRWDRRRMMMWSDVGRTVLVALVPLAAVTGVPVLPVIYAITVPVGVLYAVFEAACLSCVPSLVGRDRLAEANSLLSVGNGLGYLVGPALAGVLVAAVGGALTLGVDAVTFALSALTLMLIRRPLQTRSRQDGARVPAPMRRQIHEGFVFVVRHRLLRSTLLYWAAITFFTSPVIICATYFVREDLGWSPQTLGLIITVYAVGVIVGSLAATGFARSPGLAMAGSTLVGGAALLVLAWTSWLPLTLGLALLAGTGEGVAGVLYNTLRAQLTPDHLLGRVVTTAQVATFGLRPLAVFAAGIALDLSSGSATLVGIGVACLVLSLIFAGRNAFAAAPVPVSVSVSHSQVRK